MIFLKKYFILIVGLAIMAFGVAFSIKADLGTSPISSLPYTVSLISPLSVGIATIIMHCFFILLQIIILGKKYDKIQLLQLPVALIFGFMTDGANAVIGNITYSSYLVQWILCIVGILLVALGVSIEVYANAVPLAGEGLSLAICTRFDKKFANVKILFDISLVIVAALVGLIAKGKILGIREGTVAAAVFVGFTSRFFTKALVKLFKKQ